MVLLEPIIKYSFVRWRLLGGGLDTLRLGVEPNHWSNLFAFTSLSRFRLVLETFSFSFGASFFPEAIPCKVSAC